MAAARCDITIEQNATFTLILTWKDSNGEAVNLTGCTAAAQIRSGYTAAEAALSLATEITPGEGKVTLTASATATAAYTLQGGVWDLIVTTADGNVTRLLKGNVKLSQAVTR